MKRWTWMLVLTLCALAACDKADEASDEFGAALPEPEMLELSFGDTQSLSGALGADAEGEAAALPGGYRASAQAVMDHLNALVADTHAALEAFRAAVVPVEVTKGATTCRIWEGDHAAVHWSLTSCLKDKGAKKYGFVLKGRPVASTSDDDYLVVLAGEGKAMPAWSGKKRGIGHVGYNFDHLAALNGSAIGGRLGIAYRAVGLVRSLNIGLDEVAGPESEVARSGVYRFRSLGEKGGRFAYIDAGDYLTRTDGGALTAGQDGLIEWVRSAAAWRADGFARTVRAACEGTVGEHQCVRVAECWSAGEALSWQTLLDEDEEITWSPTACKEVPLAIEGLPGDDDSQAPKDKDAEAEAPLMPEPEILPEEAE